MKRPKRWNHNETGLTLLEIVVALGVGMIVLLMMSSTLTYIHRVFIRANDAIDTELDYLTGEAFLTRFFRGASLSFNIITTPDDAGRNFFDYLPDVPVNDVPSASRSRQATLGLPGGVTTFRMLVTTAESRAARYLPNNAYNEVVNTADPNVDGTISYVGLNGKNVINPEVWDPARYVMFYAPITLRSQGASMLTPPRFMAIMGRPTGSDMSVDDFGGIISNQHPLDPTITYNSGDEFLRRLPAVSSGIPLVFYRTVRAYELFVAPHPTSSKPALWARQWVAGAFTDPQLIAPDIVSLKIIRPSISLPLIKYQLELERPALGL